MGPGTGVSRIPLHYADVVPLTQKKVKQLFIPQPTHVWGMKWTFLMALCLILPLSGCLSENLETSAPDTEGESQLTRMNIVAQTLDRDVDQYSEYNVLENSSGQNTLILWAASGCRGCHELTEMIRQSIANGTISNSQMSSQSTGTLASRVESHSMRHTATTHQSNTHHG